MAGPLQGITVLDMSRFIAGPYCCMMLGDMGADVIKIENRKAGDASRNMLPFAGKGDEKVSLYYTQYNKNKRGLSLDFYNPECVEIIKKLVAKADVLVENFRPGTLDKMGLSPDELEKINPGLVLTSISGFGQDGPYRDRAAFDCIGQAMGGLMGLTGEAGGDPLLTGSWVADFTTGIYAAFGTVTALVHKLRTGEGQRLDIALIECVLSLLATAVPHYVETGEIQPRRGNRDNVTGPANAFRCKDGMIYLHAGTDPLFARLTKLMGRPELNEDPRYDTANKRMTCILEVEEYVQEWIGTLNVDEAEELLVDAGVPVSKIADVSDLVENVQFKHRDAIYYRQYHDVGEISLPGITVKMSKTPGALEKLPPKLGEHNQEILSSFLHMTEEEIADLAARKLI
ncbi:MAG: CoA transferase [Planctomycetaceae bacterium]|nr:CoA transferase [Planctomycetaceae bacterium]